MNYLDCLPTEIVEVLRGVGGVSEVRLRNGQAVVVNVDAKRYYVASDGLTADKNKALVFDGSCDEVVRRACNGSIYAYETMLASGYFTLCDGTRVGVGGDYVADNKVFRSFRSLCFRVPHLVSFPQNEVCRALAEEQCVAFVGPPSSGKTTALRNFAAYLAERVDVVVVDQRGELCPDGFVLNADVLFGADKQYAFEVAVRSLSPSWVVCDEVVLKEVDSLCDCVNSGVNVAFSMHGSDEKDIRERFGNKLTCVTKAVVLSREHRLRVVTPQKDGTMTKNRGL